MVYVMDTFLTATVSLPAEGYGKLGVVEWPPDVAAPGEWFTVELGVRNDGGPDTCFVEIVDADTGESVASSEAYLKSGGYLKAYLDCQMPYKEWHLEFRAGHVE